MAKAKGRTPDCLRAYRREVERWVHPKRRYVRITWEVTPPLGGKPYLTSECFKLVGGRIFWS